MYNTIQRTMKTTKTILFILIFLLKTLGVKCKGEMEPFVIDGVFANILNFPHAVRLSTVCDGSAWMCGASILNQKLLLTAAHCVFCNKPAIKLTAYAGNEKFIKSTVVRDVSKAVWHSEYNYVTMENDIALLLLSKHITLNDTSKRVMITQNFPFNHVGYLAGWGTINAETNELPSQLRAVPQSIRSAQVCQVLGELHDGMFCAGSRKNDVPRPAVGDSGCAFVMGHPLYHQVGILSWSTTTYPAMQVYTNVSYYNIWIRTKFKQLMCLKTNIRS